MPRILDAMIGNPAHFEAIGNRLGFHAQLQTPQRLVFRWQGARFPAFLCLGIALLLLFVSVPILEALHQRGFVGPAGSLWYFPLMNLVLFGISVFLITQRRSIELDNDKRQITLRRQSLYRTQSLVAPYDEIARISLVMDRVYSGFAIAGSTAGESFPIPALRLTFENGANALLDRSSVRRLMEIANPISERIGKPIEVAPELESEKLTQAVALKDQERIN